MLLRTVYYTTNSMVCLFQSTRGVKTPVALDAPAFVLRTVQIPVVLPELLGLLEVLEVLGGDEKHETNCRAAYKRI